MRGAHLLLIVNTSTCWKMELHLSNLVVLCCLLHRRPTEIHGFNNNIDMVNTLRFLVLSQFFADSMGPLKDWVTHCSPILMHYTVALIFAIPRHGHIFPVVDYVGVHSKITTQINAVNTVTMIKVRFYWLSCFLRNCFLYVAP